LVLSSSKGELALKLVWISDPHFNFLPHSEIVQAVINGFEDSGDVVLYTGDISNGRNLANTLELMTPEKSFFVAGNHDYYHSSWKKVDDICSKAKPFWLDKCSPVKLTENTVLCGVGGWADGNFVKEPGVRVNDHTEIAELAAHPVNSSGTLSLIEKRSQKEKDKLEKQLIEAIKLNPETILIATHVPIFKEVNLSPDYMPSGLEWLVHFNWSAPRDILIEMAQNNPSINFLSLSGHTHTNAAFKILNNLSAKVAKAEYRQPVIQEIIEVD
jgi:predicted phosphohydrolase